MLASLSNFIYYHKIKSKNDDLRLGQRFYNLYIKHPWPALLYAHDDMAMIMIEKWLYDHQYYDVLPPMRNN